MQAKTNLHARKNMLSICFQLGQNLFLSAPKIKQLILYRKNCCHQSWGMRACVRCRKNIYIKRTRCHLKQTGGIFLKKHECFRVGRWGVIFTEFLQRKTQTTWCISVVPWIVKLKIKSCTFQSVKYDVPSACL